MQNQRIYAFGPFRLDARARLLERAGQPVTLTPKVIDTLLVLVENQDRLLSKEELMTAIWPDTHVEEGNLVSNISILRKTLGETDDGRPYIQTLPKRGYRFAADVVESREEETIVAIRESHRSRVVVDEEEIQGGTAWSKLLWAGAGILLAIAAAVIWIWVAGKNTPTTFSVTQLTADPGYEGEPTFAPDSRTIAYVSDRTGRFDIFLKQVSGGPDINLTNGVGDNIQPAFSPDGSQIAFVSSRSGSISGVIITEAILRRGGEVWIMPALGGSARRITESGNFPSWSPDGFQILYISGPWFKRTILQVSAAGGEPREIPIRFKAEERVPGNLMYPAYSPDGKWILFQGDNVIYVVASEGGEPAAVGNGGHPVWDTNTKGIIYSSAEAGRNYSLSILPFSSGSGRVSGPPRALTIGRGRDTQAAVSRDGKLIAYAATAQTSNVESLPFDAEAGRVTGTPRQVTSGNQMIGFMCSSPDARSLVFGSSQGAGSHIWRLDTGSAAVELLSDPAFSDTSPQWSPDGRVIGFQRQPANKPQADTDLWLIQPDGANPRLLMRASGQIRWLPDSQGLVYFSRPERQLYVLNIADGHVRRLTNEPQVMPIAAVSADGKWVAYQSTAAGNVDVRAILIEGGPSRPVITTPHQDYHPFFSPSGRWLYFYPDHKNIYRVPGPAQNWKSAEPEKVTDFPESGLPLIEDPQITRDGKQLLYTHGRTSADIWILHR